MAWKPSTRFEDDLLDSQPGCNFVLGQMAYEKKREAEYTPRPSDTYDFLADRNKRNAVIDKLHGPASSKTKGIQDCLAMMERIQQIAGTKPLGEHATMEDWNDTSTVEREAVAMMRHFGLMSMGVESMKPLPLKEETEPKGPIQVLCNGR
ncbi:GL19649 [Drosophila persimilis]|uniref:GL19649 n=1 Tax=Drosophila persimilis TaxID=7234 RepID=B4G7R2_DROPE|nr:GL19649 [Drosophila persimilis]